MGPPKRFKKDNGINLFFILKLNLKNLQFLTINFIIFTTFSIN